MTTSAPVSPAPTPLAAATVPDPDTCSTCPHPLEQHDAIALRYCAATMAAALGRGCICQSSTPV